MLWFVSGRIYIVTVTNYYLLVWRGWNSRVNNDNCGEIIRARVERYLWWYLEMNTIKWFFIEPQERVRDSYIHWRWSLLMRFALCTAVHRINAKIYCNSIMVTSSGLYDFSLLLQPFLSGSVFSSASYSSRVTCPGIFTTCCSST